MGTGCDTILAQIAAEALDCPLENISVLGADTDSSPYDSGSYASSTTYVTGKAVEQCALALREKDHGARRAYARVQRGRRAPHRELRRNGGRGEGRLARGDRARLPSAEMRSRSKRP